MDSARAGIDLVGARAWTERGARRTELGEESSHRGDDAIVLSALLRTLQRFVDERLHRKP